MRKWQGVERGERNGSQRGWGHGELSRERSGKNYYYYLRAIGCDPFFDGVQPCGRGAQFYNLYRHFCGNK